MRMVIIEELFFCFKKFRLNASQDLFLKQCPYTNCRFTCDRQQLPGSDAVLFHEADVNAELDSDESAFWQTLTAQRRHKNQAGFRIFTIA
jgi:hypothetical protein